METIVLFEVAIEKTVVNALVMQKGTEVNLLKGVIRIPPVCLIILLLTITAVLVILM